MVTVTYCHWVLLTMHCAGADVSVAAGSLCLQMTGLCAADLFHANIVAREMILSAGMGRKIGEYLLNYS